jgi:hypothetical protein
MTRVNAGSEEMEASTLSASTGFGGFGGLVEPAYQVEDAGGGKTEGDGVSHACLVVEAGLGLLVVRNRKRLRG